MRQTLSIVPGHFQGVRSMAYEPKLLETHSNESVLKTSLLRDVSVSVVNNQYKRVLDGRNVLTDYEFIFMRPQEERFAGVSLEFDIKAESSPRSNIHAVIGRNGAGKTTLLNEMTLAVINKDASSGRFFEKGFFSSEEIGDDYFSSLVSVAFSAFDPFEPPAEQHDPTLGTCYYYIGLKRPEGQSTEGLKTLDELHADFVSNLEYCFSQDAKKQRWLGAI